jgi:hypothetical protein
MTDENKIAALRALQNDLGWKLIQEELDSDLAITESKLFGYTPLKEGETIEQLQRERMDRLELRNLPEHLIREISDAEHEEEDFEVYPTQE